MWKKSIVPFDGGRNMKQCFPQLGCFARQTLGIVDSQIEIQRIFSLAEILTNLKRCRS
jgi:hypothetical protein